MFNNQGGGEPSGIPRADTSGKRAQVNNDDGKEAVAEHYVLLQKKFTFS
jgi:hypothetical protein